jgi:tetratricopeptide (TPR) repeat protein
MRDWDACLQSATVTCVANKILEEVLEQSEFRRPQFAFLMRAPHLAPASLATDVLEQIRDANLRQSLLPSLAHDFAFSHNFVDAIKCADQIVDTEKQQETLRTIISWMSHAKQFPLAEQAIARIADVKLRNHLVGHIRWSRIFDHLNNSRANEAENELNTETNEVFKIGILVRIASGLHQSGQEARALTLLQEAFNTLRSPTLDIHNWRPTAGSLLPEEAFEDLARAGLREWIYNFIELTLERMEGDEWARFEAISVLAKVGDVEGARLNLTSIITGAVFRDAAAEVAVAMAKGDRTGHKTQEFLSSLADRGPKGYDLIKVAMSFMDDGNLVAAEEIASKVERIHHKTDYVVKRLYLLSSNGGCSAEMLSQAAADLNVAGAYSHIAHLANIAVRAGRIEQAQTLFTHAVRVAASYEPPLADTLKHVVAAMTTAAHFTVVERVTVPEWAQRVPAVPPNRRVM